MMPRKREYEQVAVDEWLVGEIADIQYEQDHESMYKGVKKVGDAVKIYIKLDGYRDKKSTGWWSFNYAEKSNLYNIFIKALVPNAAPNMLYDLDNLKGMKIKAMYTQNGEYQNLSMVRPLISKGPALGNVPNTEVAETHENITDEEPPF